MQEVLMHHRTVSGEERDAIKGAFSEMETGMSCIVRSSVFSSTSLYGFKR